MDKDSAKVDEKLKDEVKNKLFQKIILGLQTNQMNLVQKRQSAGYILDNVDAVKNIDELIFFLDSLRVRWMIFNDIYNIFKGKSYQEKEKEVIDKLTSYIHNLN